MSYGCKTCGCRLLAVSVDKSALILFNESDDDHEVLDDCVGSDTEFNDQSEAQCERCGEQGPLLKFKGEN